MALAGDLSEFPLTDIIQLIQLSKQTGGVYLSGQCRAQALEGWIYFRDGKIIGATSPGMAPLAALYAFFTLTAGPFRFDDQQRLAQPTISLSNELLIMEGVNRQDTWLRIEQTLPSLDLVPRILINPTSSTAEIDLDPTEWRILTMVNGKNSVDAIVQRSGLGEFRTCEILTRLIEVGLVTVKAYLA
ncbi:MAG: DUF4388 domain-containing protein [Chloroflexia bacterium]|nr:DUF4388 domain-containing protein [Chloroflexia bacterium]